MTESMTGKLQQLHEEIAYQYILKMFDKFFPELFPLQYKTLEYEKESMTESELLVKKIEINFKRFSYLESIVKSNLEYINKALKIDAEKKCLLPNPHLKKHWNLSNN